MNLRNFLAELKRRNVYKVAAAYAVVAWLLIQVATQVFPFFRIPNWTVRLIVLLLILGFPVALILSWAFEITPEGIKREEEVDRSRSITRKTGRKLVGITMVLAVLAAGLFTFQVLRPKLMRESTATSAQSPTASVIPNKSIAVLPFENLSSDKENAYFAAGIQDEILTALAKISDLKVISRTSSAKYKSHPDNLKTIAEELRVAAILEGSVQKAGEMVHIAVQLISGHNDSHLWAESYDRELKNIFSVEREVAETVAAQLKAKLLPEEATQLARVPTTNPQAYDLYLKGNYIIWQFWNAQVDSNKPGVDFYRQAIALDPGFALAYAGLARAELRMYSGGEDRSPERIADAQANAERSLALQPDLIEGHLARAGVYIAKHDDASALVEYESLLKRSPNDADVISRVANLKKQAGDWQAALTGRLRACELDPRNSQYIRWLADIYCELNRYPEADQTYLKALALAPDDWFARSNRALMFVYQGKLADAREMMMAWPDTELKETALSLKYSTLQYVETLSRNYDAALTNGLKIPAIDRRIPTLVIPIGDIKKNTDIGLDSLYKGDALGAHRAFRAAQEGLELERAGYVDVPEFYNAEALVAAGMDDRETAVTAARKAVALMPIEKNARNGLLYLLTLAQIYAHFGDGDQAIPLIQKLLDTRGTGDIISPALLRLDPIWDPIRGDLRFEKLLAAEPLEPTPTKP